MTKPQTKTALDYLTRADFQLNEAYDPEACVNLLTELLAIVPDMPWELQRLMLRAKDEADIGSLIQADTYLMLAMRELKPTTTRQPVTI